jgi:hypothetical protein
LSRGHGIPQNRQAVNTDTYRENGYINQPIPMPTSRNKSNDHPMYFKRSSAGLRLKNPNAIEIPKANRNIA